RELAIGALKQDAPPCESVEVGRLGLAASITTQRGGQIVGHEQQDVGARGSLSAGYLHGQRPEEQLDEQGACDQRAYHERHSPRIVHGCLARFFFFAPCDFCAAPALASAPLLPVADWIAGRGR